MAGVLAGIVDDGADVERAVRRLRDLEHRGDEITHRIFNALHSTFVTPLDRADIRDLAVELDNFVDDVEEAGRRGRLRQAVEPVVPARLLADVAKRDAPLRERIVEIHRLENEADDALNQALVGLYDEATDVPSLVRCIRLGGAVRAARGRDRPRRGRRRRARRDPAHECLTLPCWCWS